MGNIATVDYFIFYRLGLYALSRHRCWRVFLCFVVDKNVLVVVVVVVVVGRLITALSITSVTAFMSCVFVDNIIADKGIPCLSVKICLFVPSLLLSVGLLPVSAPPMVI